MATYLWNVPVYVEMMQISCYSYCLILSYKVLNLLAQPLYLEQAMMEFHRTLQTHWYPQDEHLYYYKKKARGQFC